MNRYGLTQQQIDDIHACFRAHPSVRRVILYGSRAKGNYRPGSDIDLVIEDEGMTFAELMALENALDDLMLPVRIDLSLMRQISSEDLLAHIHRVGVEFYALPRDSGMLLSSQAGQIL